MWFQLDKTTNYIALAVAAVVAGAGWTVGSWLGDRAAGTIERSVTSLIRKGEEETTKKGRAAA